MMGGHAPYSTVREGKGGLVCNTVIHMCCVHEVHKNNQGHDLTVCADIGSKQVGPLIPASLMQDRVTIFKRMVTLICSSFESTFKASKDTDF